jgi:hypothetical protein
MKHAFSRGNRYIDSRASIPLTNRKNWLIDFVEVKTTSNYVVFGNGVDLFLEGYVTNFWFMFELAAMKFK